MRTELTQTDLDDLSAYLDGELDAASTLRVEQLTSSDEAWREALAEMKSVDRAIDVFRTQSHVPPHSANLVQRIVAAATPQRSRWLVRLGAPLAAAAAVAIVAFVLVGKDKPVTHNNNGDKAALIATVLDEISGGSLADAIRQHPGWDKLTAEQKQTYRIEVLSYLQMTPEQQDQAINRFSELSKMSPEERKQHRLQAEWIQVVADSFSAEERKELSLMSPQARSRKMLLRKEELIRQGKIDAE